MFIMDYFDGPFYLYFENFFTCMTTVFNRASLPTIFVSSRRSQSSNASFLAFLFVFGVRRSGVRLISVWECDDIHIYILSYDHSSCYSYLFLFLSPGRVYKRMFFMKTMRLMIWRSRIKRNSIHANTFSLKKSSQSPLVCYIKIWLSRQKRQSSNVC